MRRARRTRHQDIEKTVLAAVFLYATVILFAAIILYAAAGLPCDAHRRRDGAGRDCGQDTSPAGLSGTAAGGAAPNGRNKKIGKIG